MWMYKRTAYVYLFPLAALSTDNMGRCIMFSMITNIYNKKTKGPTLMELFTATRKLQVSKVRWQLWDTQYVPTLPLT
jgi:hypothetical protein